VTLRAMAAGVTDKLWEVSDIVAMLEQWELANIKPEYQFVVRQYMIGKGQPLLPLLFEAIDFTEESPD